MGENFTNCLEIDFGGDNFHVFAESQFATPTNVTYEFENEMRTCQLQSPYRATQ